MSALAARRVALIERRGSFSSDGSLAPDLVACLAARGARVLLVHAELGVHRIDRRPPWEIAVLKSGSPPALHLAAAARAFGVPCVNEPDATRLAQDRLAWPAVLERAGLPIAHSTSAWLDGRLPASAAPRLPLLLKTQRGSQGVGTWTVDRLQNGHATFDVGPYLVMDRVEHAGDDLKVFVAGAWMRAVSRRYPANSLAEKQGRPAVLPDDVAETTTRVGQLLGLSCYGCDFVRGDDGWTLVDVNAFPGYKGAAGAAVAVADVIERALEDAA